MKTRTPNPYDLVEALRPLQDYFPEATAGFLSRLAWEIWQLEITGFTHFGGPEIMAWWLVQRCTPRPAMTRAKIRKLQRMCGGGARKPWISWWPWPRRTAAPGGGPTGGPSSSSAAT